MTSIASTASWLEMWMIRDYQLIWVQEYHASTNPRRLIRSEYQMLQLQ
jgi:hypothetical protein